MPLALDIASHRFGRLYVLREAMRPIGRKWRSWTCRCDCGSEVEVSQACLVHGKARSCGCLRSEVTAIKNTTHGLSATDLYRTWKGMIQRCHNPRSKSYGRYGGRGISVCQEWRGDFLKFATDMGPKPNGMSIERRNNDAGYGPGNCCWATTKEQNNNRRKRSSFPLRKRGQFTK